TLHCGRAEIIEAPGGSNDLSSNCSSSGIDDITQLDLVTGVAAKVGAVPHYVVLDQQDGSFFAQSPNDDSTQPLTFGPFALGAGPALIPGTNVGYAPVWNAWLYNARGFIDDFAFGDSTYFLNNGTFGASALVRRTGAASTVLSFNTLTGDSWVADLRAAGSKLLILSGLEGTADASLRQNIRPSGSLWLYDPAAAFTTAANGARPLCGVSGANPCVLGFPDGDLLQADSRGVLVGSDGAMVLAGKKGAFSCTADSTPSCALDGAHATRDVYAFDASGVFVKAYGVGVPLQRSLGQGACVLYFEQGGVAQFTDAFTGSSFIPAVHSQSDCEQETVQYYWGGDPHDSGYDWAVSYTPDLAVTESFNPDLVAPAADGSLDALSSEVLAISTATSWDFVIDRGNGPVAITVPLQPMYFQEEPQVRRFAR
ncbi:MAG: hypothetical protein JST92_27570, partial [Deltaproteobacteria bacterium]|nr:hypothetical protein [Deltaproteobacteria bacterium]